MEKPPTHYNTLLETTINWLRDLLRNLWFGRRLLEETQSRICYLTLNPAHPELSTCRETVTSRGHSSSCRQTLLWMHFHRHRRSTVCTPSKGAYLAFGSCHLCKQSLGNFSTLHFLLNLVVNGSINVHGIVLWFPIPLSGNSSCFHLQNILNMPVIYHWPNCFEASQAQHPNWTLMLLLRSRWSAGRSFNMSY